MDDWYDWLFLLLLSPALIVAACGFIVAVIAAYNFGKVLIQAVRGKL